MFSKAKAETAIGFIEQLKHTKGRWHGVKFDLLDWQEEPIRDIFGTVKPNGFRQYTTAYLEIPKKNGKSEMGAAVGLYMTCGDAEHGAEVYGCAGDRQQASIVFDVAVNMVDQCPALKKRIKPVLSQKRLVFLPTRSFYQVLSAEAYSKHGLNVHACIFDELHTQPDRKLWDVMTKGSGDARTQPLYFVITTSGDDPDRHSIGWEVHQKAVDVLTGAKVDPSFYSLVYGIDPIENRIYTGRSYETVDNLVGDTEERWRLPEIWTKVNPSIEQIIPMEKVETAYQSAVGNDADERIFRWLRLNEWVKYGAAKWLGIEVWDASSSGMIIPENLKGPCYGGLDLSSKTDLTAFVLVFPPFENRTKWAVLPTLWIPQESVKQRAEKDKVPYLSWIKSGFIKTTSGNVVDYGFIRQEIVRLRDRYDIKEIGFDPWNANQIALDLSDDGLTMVEVRQGFKTMSPAMKELEKLIVGKELEHGGNPALRWMFGNMAVKKDENENIRPVKDKSTERIDGIVAMVNAICCAIVHADNTPVYEKGGVFSV
jgi:phage terminase large subunit-like protein